MGAITEEKNFIDVICQHTKKGDIIPIRIRLQDEDGMIQTYTIKGYKEISSHGSYTSPYGTLEHNSLWKFVCKIQVFDVMKQIELFYNSNDNLWRITRIY